MHVKVRNHLTGVVSQKARTPQSVFELSGSIEKVQVPCIYQMSFLVFRRMLAATFFVWGDFRDMQTQSHGQSSVLQQMESRSLVRVNIAVTSHKLCFPSFC